MKRNIAKILSSLFAIALLFGCAQDTEEPEETPMDDEIMDETEQEETGEPEEGLSDPEDEAGQDEAGQEDAGMNGQDDTEDTGENGDSIEIGDENQETEDEEE